MTKYIHRTQEHNRIAPKEIVPLLIDKIHPKSVVDVGCGLGTFLSVFIENGITDVMGYDGDWVDQNLLSENIDISYFTPFNLENTIKTNRRYDIAICLEVAEHLKSENADTIVESLVGLSDTIVFSAAIPFQGGQNHINEQWPDYWSKKFKEHNYTMMDYLRPLLWDNENIFYWYKQNIFLVVKDDKKEYIKSLFNDSIKNDSTLSLVHPECYLSKIYELKNMQQYNKAIIEGDLRYKDYIKMILKHTKRIFSKSQH